MSKTGYNTEISFNPPKDKVTPSKNELFKLELLMSQRERYLLQELVKDPQNKDLRNVYADWLEEQGRSLSSQMVREGYIPGHCHSITSYIQPFTAHMEAAGDDGSGDANPTHVDYPASAEAMQRHHDYYIDRRTRGLLTEEDRPQLELALQREHLGAVRPHNRTSVVNCSTTPDVTSLSAQQWQIIGPEGPHQKSYTHCSYCNMPLTAPPDEDYTITIDSAGKQLALCNSCYRKAGNTVR